VQENIFIQIEFVSFIDTHYNILLYVEILIAKYINGLKFIGNLEYKRKLIKNISLIK